MDRLSQFYDNAVDYTDELDKRLLHFMTTNETMVKLDKAIVEVMDNAAEKLDDIITDVFGDDHNYQDLNAGTEMLEIVDDEEAVQLDE